MTAGEDSLIIRMIRGFLLTFFVYLMMALLPWTIRLYIFLFSRRPGPPSGSGSPRQH